MQAKTILDLLCQDIENGNIQTTIEIATVSKNQDRTEATATVQIRTVDSTGAPHIQTITENFSL